MEQLNIHVFRDEIIGQFKDFEANYIAEHEVMATEFHTKSNSVMGIIYAIDVVGDTHLKFLGRTESKTLFTIILPRNELSFLLFGTATKFIHWDRVRIWQEKDS